MAPLCSLSNSRAKYVHVLAYVWHIKHIRNNSINLVHCLINCKKKSLNGYVFWYKGTNYKKSSISSDRHSCHNLIHIIEEFQAWRILKSYFDSRSSKKWITQKWRQNSLRLWQEFWSEKQMTSLNGSIYKKNSCEIGSS